MLSYIYNDNAKEEDSEGGILSYFKSFLQSLLRSLGLYQKSGTILLLGLDNSGKSTFLHKLRTNSILSFPPTERPHVETFHAEGVTFAGWDLGGHEAVRHLWEDYVCEASAVLFLVDASDSTRLVEVGEELDALVHDGIIEDVPLAILLNKCDLESALPSQYIAESIWFEEVVKRHGEEKIGMFRMSVLRGEGYQDAIRWVASFL